MYSKITHTIVEEHFGHPTATNIKKSVDKNLPNRTKSKFATPTTTDAFRSDVNNYMNNYMTILTNLVNAVNASETEMTAVEQTAFKNVSGLGDLVKDIYPIQIYEGITQIMRSTILSLIQSVHLVRVGVDTKDWVNGKFNTTLADGLAQSMNGANNDWKYQAVKDLYITMCNSLVAQAKARMAKNTAAEQQQATKARDAATAFAKLFVDGVISQHPELFVDQTATPSTYSRSDIM